MRSRGTLEAVFLLLLAAGKPFFSSAATSDSKYPYEPIKDVDASAYIGRWYQMYASASVIYTFELGGNCVTADYFATDKDRTIRVKNTVRPFATLLNGGSLWQDILQDCTALVVNGFLSQSDDVDGQGSVDLQPGPIPLGIGTPNINDVMYEAPGNYWIIELGPIGNGKYRWAFVTNSDQTQLYFLARDRDEFEEYFEEEALQLAKKWGFDSPTNKPIKTNQENCGFSDSDDDDSDDDDDSKSKSKDR